MTNSKFDYLRNMGVDVWTRRENILDIATVKGLSDAPVESVAVARSGTQAGPSALASPEPVSLATNQAETSPENATGIPALRAIAAQLRNPESKNAVGASAGADNLASEQSQDIRPKTERFAPSPEFLFCFLDYVPEAGEGVTLVFSLPYETQSLPREARQFSDDVARALFGKSVNPVVGDLRWPMVRSTHIAQTESEAKTVVVDRVRRCQSKLILFGETIQHYVVGARGVAHQEVYQALDYAQYWAAPEPGNQPSVFPKHELWRLVTEVRSALQKGAQDVP
jgi:hypothetical protein